MEILSLIWKLTLFFKKKKSKVVLTVEVFVKGWPTDKELEMLPSSWISVDEGIDLKVQRNCNARVGKLWKT